MLYVCIDIETTGLDPVNDQILQIAAVIRDTHYMNIPIEESPWISYLVEHQRYQGSAYGLSLNSRLLAELGKKLEEKSLPYTTHADAARTLYEFLIINGFRPSDDSGRIKFTPAGKNFATFDLQFLKNLPDWSKYFMPCNRVLDPTILFFEPNDNQLPDLKTCLQRSGVNKKISHDALEDARDTIAVIERGLKKLWEL